MATNKYDIIVIGAGSGGLSVGLFMNKAGFKVLMLSKSDTAIGGDCLNEGCVPSKALIHIAKLIKSAKQAAAFGLTLSGKIDIKKTIEYIYGKQEIIRKHENAQWLKDQGIDVELGNACFTNKNEIEVNGKKFEAKKIVIATGSVPKKLSIKGVENITYYDNENIFHLNELPEKLLVAGGGPISIEIAQALNRLGTKVTVVENSDMILNKEDKSIAGILLAQLKKEGINFIMNAEIESFISSNEAKIKSESGSNYTIQFDAVFAGIGRTLKLDGLQLQHAGIEIKNNKIVVDQFLRTTNKNIFVCGDIAGDLQFSHAAEFHARILLNNFFSPFKKKLNNKHMSWVTFTDPQLATFGLNEKELILKKIPFRKLEQDFNSDDRAVVDNYQYGKLVLFISKGNLLKKQKILGGTMVAPNAGELIQELILVNTGKLSINSIFNKVYPYPVAARINQQLIIKLKEEALTGTVKKLLKKAYQIFS